MLVLKSLIFSFALFFVTTVTALSGPRVDNVTGILSNGSLLEITGANFGSHGDYNAQRNYIILAWENFESGVADSIFTANFGPELVIDTDVQKRNSKYAAKGYYWGTPKTYTNVWGKTITAATMYGFHFNLGDKNYQKKVFISGWFMFPEGFDVGINYDATITDQTKFLSLTPLKTLNNGQSDGAKTYFQTRKGTTVIPLRTETEDGYLSEGDKDPLFNYAPMGTWHRFDIYVDLTKPDGQKIHNWYVDGKKIIRINNYYNNDAALIANGVINGFNYLSWLMFQFQGTDVPSWPQYMDDAFANLTQARVEISANPTWDETKQVHKEIQIPVSWTENSITIQLNLGSLEDGKPLYLYVVDDEGNVNLKGRPVHAPFKK
jgi:hypothetical protein